MNDKLLTVVIGAGASADCVEKGVAEFDEDWRPPFVGDLFKFKTTFNKILHKYPGAEILSEQIRTRLKNENISLEALLRQYESISDLSLRRYFWEVPLYLQELLGEVTVNFVIRGCTKFDTMALQFQQSRFEKVLILTLNYDLFLEKALERIGYSFHEISSYISSERKIILCKLHGSVNWGQECLDSWSGPETISNVLRYIREKPNLNPNISMPVGFSYEHRFINGKFFFPSLAVPVEGKSGFVCPPLHTEQVKKILTECPNFLFIGFSALDHDVMELLSLVHKVHNLKVVNGRKKAGLQVLGRLTKANSLFEPMTPGAEEGFLYASGFKDFVSSGGLETYLNSED